MLYIGTLTYSPNTCYQIDILTFYMWDLFLRRILMILQFFIQFDNMY
jgi:hypothetical protein